MTSALALFEQNNLFFFPPRNVPCFVLPKGLETILISSEKCKKLVSAMALNKPPPIFSNFAGKCGKCRLSALLFVTKKQENKSLKRFSCFGGNVLGGSLLRRVRGSEGRVWDGNDDKMVDGNMALELEIFEFMEKSGKPNDFPTKEELITAGRLDLVKEILAVGGWLAAGWHLEEDENQECEIEVLENLNDSSFYNNYEMRSKKSSSTSARRDSLVVDGSASSSGRSTEIDNGDVGIEGILKQLKKERNRSYASELREKEDKSVYTVASNEKSSKSTSLETDLFNESGGFPSQNMAFSNIDGNIISHKLRDWKVWSLQRVAHTKTGSGDNFVLDESRDERISDHDSVTNILATGDELYDHSRSMRKELNSDDQAQYESSIQSRIQNLDLELTSVLHLLRSKTDMLVSTKVQGSSLEELHKLSDAWEYQETEIKKTRDKLRSTRAKIAVLEGKMALEIAEAYKVVQEKQKRIEEAQKVLSVLRSTCIVWPSLGSEVFLAGSFDGWTSQRRMERSSIGEFYLNLKLYPGRYEIKFVVDGVWRVDPLRPVVNYYGYENNVIIIN